MRGQGNGFASAGRGERGSATMLAAVGMVLLLTVVASFVALAQVESKIGVNHVQEVRAIQAAEAGARRVLAEISNGGETASDWLAKARPYLTNVAVDSTGTATYTVSVADNSANAGGPDTDNLVAIESVGTSGGASRTAYPSPARMPATWVPCPARSSVASLSSPPTKLRCRSRPAAAPAGR